MNKKGVVEDLGELLFAVIVLIIVILFCLFFKTSHDSAIATAAASYDDKINTFYALDNILRSEFNITGKDGEVRDSMADFIALSVEEKSSFFNNLFGSSIRGDVKKKFADLAAFSGFNGGITVKYKGDSYLLYTYSPNNCEGVWYSDSLNIPSFEGDLIELVVQRFVVTGCRNAK